MWLLVLGVVLFLGIHSVRIFAPAWRESQIAKRGDGPWKGIYSIISVVGLIFLIYGYGVAREDAGQVFVPPHWSRSLLLIAMPISLILFIASNFPAGYIKRLFGHPMLWGIIIWSAAHLMANGDAASALLFGGFLVWAVIDFVSATRRPTVKTSDVLVWPDIVSIVVGLLLTLAIMFYLHEWLIGVPVV